MPNSRQPRAALEVLPLETPPGGEARVKRLQRSRRQLDVLAVFVRNKGLKRRGAKTHRAEPLRQSEQFVSLDTVAMALSIGASGALD